MNEYYNPYGAYRFPPMQGAYGAYPYIENMSMDITTAPIKLQDYGPEPIVVNIDNITKRNNYFRTALWTGEHLQVTLMSINVNESVGLEVHPNLDQFVRIEQGQGIVMIGDDKDSLNYRRVVSDDFAFIIPAGKWHNLINTGNIPIKLYSIYAPPEHPAGTVHKTKFEAEASE